MDKKQLIIPVLTLLLCASVIIGVGYGITSNTTVTDSENGVAANEITIDLKDGNGALGAKAFDSGKIDYTTDIKYVNGTPTTTYSVAAGQVVVLNDENIKLVATNGGVAQPGTVTVEITGDAATNMSDYFSKVSVQIGATTVEDSNLSDGLNFEIAGFDGNPANVIIKGVTKAVGPVGDAPAISGTFDVKFTIAVTVQGTA